MSKWMNPSRAPIAVATAAACLSIGAGLALAAPGSLTFADGEQDGVAGVQGLDGVFGLASSPDGRNLYAAGYDDRSLVSFGRDPATGALTFLGSLADGAGGGDKLSGATGVAVSPDGRNVYVTAGADGSVTVFSRDSAGAVTFVEAEQDGLTGSGEQPNLVAVSPDGKNVYVTTYNGDSVISFARDATTGALTKVDADVDGVGGVDGIDQASDVVVSPEGKNVYVTGAEDDAVTTFNRDKGTGQLTFADADVDDATGGNALAGAYALAISPDGRNLYVTARADHAVVAFARDANGAISHLGDSEDGIGGVEGIRTPYGIAIAPDGSHVYAGGFDDDAVATFVRDATTDVLSFVEADVDGSSGGGLLMGAFRVEVPCDGRSVYVSSDEDAITGFAVEGAGGSCAPTLELAVKGKQKLGKKVALTATCGNELCSVQAAGKLKARKSAELKPVTAELGFQQTETLALKLGRKARKLGDAALDAGKKAKIKLTATATDPAGNATPEAATIKLK